MFRVNRPAWLVVHILNIVIHIGMVITGAVTFVTNGLLSRRTFGGESRINLVLYPWAAFALGTLGAAFNFYLISALRSATQARSGTEQDRYFRKQLCFGIGWFFALIELAGDYAMAHALHSVVSGSIWLRGPLAFSALAVVMSMVMIVFDIAVFLEERSDYLRAIEPEEEALTTDIEAFYRDED